MYSRKDVNSKQIKLLFSKGFICVSVDYRLCPEVNLLEGPMTDVRDALRWIRHELPSLKLDCPGLRVDGDRVAVVGWSTGGTLAMSLGFTPQQYGIKPPEAILAFYCPSNYDDCQYPPSFSKRPQDSQWQFSRIPSTQETRSIRQMRSTISLIVFGTNP